MLLAVVFRAAVKGSLCTAWLGVMHESVEDRVGEGGRMRAEYAEIVFIRLRQRTETRLYGGEMWIRNLSTVSSCKPRKTRE
jgi:hypothetical protein